ncbi:MAG: hypothetical protein HQL60_00885 [Magnetococcales bacterium]|nr:hypothetical protein [Magnetococcales bacterium]
MLQLIPYGLAIVVGSVLGKKIYPTVEKRKRVAAAPPRAALSSPTIQLLRESVIQENPIILAVEEIPLDNRFGNKMLVSEHEFARTATIELTLGQNRQAATEIKTHMWRLLENMAQEELRRSLNIEVGAQISRRVKITLSTEPGAMVRYKVVWKQDSRRGLFDVKIGNTIHSIPYTVAFGLSHTIESLAGEKRAID